MLVRKIKQVAISKLQQAEAVTDPLFEVDLLLEHLLKKPRVWIYTHDDWELTTEQTLTLEQWVEKRLHGYPMAYLLGRVEFYGRNFVIQEGVLIPRPETELLIEAVFEAISTARQTAFFRNSQVSEWHPSSKYLSPLRIVDLGAGSGVLGLTLAYLLPKAEIHLVEPSPEAWPCLEKNVALHASGRKIKLHQLDAETFLKSEVGLFDLIIANPPYIAVDDEEVDPWVKQWEPHIALFAEEDGLACYRRWIPGLSKVLCHQGIAAFEHGANQGEQVSSLFRQFQFKVLRKVYDYQGYWRHTLAINLGY